MTFQSGADINAKDMLKMTALHWAAQHAHHGVAETLIKHGADVHALSKFDKTPFDIAVDVQNTELMLLLQVTPTFDLRAGWSFARFCVQTDLKH